MDELDIFTGLPNRRALDAHLRAEIVDARIRGESVVLVLFNLEDFKRLNDEYGFATGDQILLEVARRLKSEQGTVGRAFRVGGNEFAFVRRVRGTEEGSTEEGRNPVDPEQAIAAPLAAPCPAGLRLRARYGWAISIGGQSTASELLAAAEQDMQWGGRRGQGPM